MTGKFNAIWRLTAGARAMYAGAIGAMVVASCFLYLAPLVPHVVIDEVIVRANDAAGAAETPSLSRAAARLLGGAEWVAVNLWWPGVVVVLFTLLAGVFTYLRGRWSALATERVIRRVRDRVYDHLQRLPARFFDTAETGDTVQRCTSDVETLRTFMSTQIVEIGRAIIMLLVPLPLMISVDWRMTIVSVVLLPAIVAFGYVFFRRIRAVFKKVDEAEGAMTTTIQENLAGIRVVRAFARQAFERSKFRDRNGAHRDLDYRLYVELSWYWSLSDLMCLAQKSIVVGFGAWWLARGELAVGAYFFFLAAVMLFLWPMRMMGRILCDLGKALVAMERIGAILDEPREDANDAPADLPHAAVNGVISFDQVTFTHGRESPVLHEVTFAVPAGRTLAILGPSGCGKSTIVNLLLRLYDADSGTIRVDGVDVRDISRTALRSCIALVMQEPFLYSKSLRDNVKIGRAAATDAEMIEATTVACVHESIARFESQYETVVGERGVTLSGGQRQRVAIARALLQRPAVLVLDDSLSAVDTETESLILEAICRRRGRHTTILIAHRLSTLMHADDILVMDKGRVIQRGDHASLVEQPGLYRRLWQIQNAAEHEVEAEAERRSELAPSAR
jgi:ATP-binding cassette subfamily B protein